MCSYFKDESVQGRIGSRTNRERLPPGRREPLLSYNYSYSYGEPTSSPSLPAATLEGRKPIGGLRDLMACLYHDGSLGGGIKNSVTWLITPYTAIVTIASGLALVTGLRIWQRRAAPGAIYLALQMLAIAEWATSLALESAAVGTPEKLFWAKAEYVGLGSSPVLLLMFAWAYRQHSNRLPLRLAVPIWIPQAVVLLAAWTNELHGLVWTSLIMAPGEGNVLIYGHGPAFFAGVAYSSLMYLAAAVVLTHAVWRARSVHRARAVTTVACFAPLWTAGTIYVLDPSLVGDVEIAPFGFILTAVLLNWTLLRHRLFDLVPVAHDVLIERMSDGLLVLDERDRIVSVNPAAQRMLWSDDTSRIGDAVSAALAAHPALVTWLSAAAEAQAELRLERGHPSLHRRALHGTARSGRLLGRSDAGSARRHRSRPGGG